MPEAANGGGCKRSLLQFLWLWAPLGVWCSGCSHLASTGEVHSTAKPQIFQLGKLVIFSLNVEQILHFKHTKLLTGRISSGPGAAFMPLFSYALVVPSAENLPQGKTSLTPCPYSFVASLGEQHSLKKPSV